MATARYVTAGRRLVVSTASFALLATIGTTLAAFALGMPTNGNGHVVTQTQMLLTDGTAVAPPLVPVLVVGLVLIAIVKFRYSAKPVFTGAAAILAVLMALVALANVHVMVQGTQFSGRRWDEFLVLDIIVTTFLGLAVIAFLVWPIKERRAKVRHRTRRREAASS